ncbi:MAG TPA: hypothetical protein VLX09_14925 [Stellaceae bacterium]|nr:hypothetical protein [Stellaceae bacterium]
MTQEALAREPITRAIDLARYPVDSLESVAGRALIEECRRQLAARGCCLLPGFLTKAAVDAMAEEAVVLVPLAHRTPNSRSTAYLDAADVSFPEDHPKRRLQATSVGAIAYDLIPPDALVRRLYEWDGLVEFLAAALGKDKLFRYADPLGGLNIASMRAGEALLWHFDQTDFVVSLLLQKCRAGGVFEYVPYVRSADEPRYDRVQALLDGSREGVIEADMEPGTLALFEGRNSIHRVSPIEGDRERLIALFGYDTKPGTMSSDRLKERRYGRIA